MNINNILFSNAVIDFFQISFIFFVKCIELNISVKSVILCVNCFACQQFQYLKYKGTFSHNIFLLSTVLHLVLFCEWALNISHMSTNLIQKLFALFSD